MVAWVSQVLLFPMAAITFSQQSTYSHRASGMTRLFSEDGVASKSKVSNISSEGTLAVLILWCAMR